MFSNTSRSALSTATGSTGMIADAMGNAAGRMSGSISSNGTNSGYFNDGNNAGKSSYMQDKLSGK